MYLMKKLHILKIIKMCVSEDIELASDLKTDFNSRVTIHPRVTIEALKAASRIRIAEFYSISLSRLT
jgi:hypothetical protein